jgi:hypothetical protein
MQDKLIGKLSIHMDFALPGNDYRGRRVMVCSREALTKGEAAEYFEDFKRTNGVICTAVWAPYPEHID